MLILEKCWNKYFLLLFYGKCSYFKFNPAFSEKNWLAIMAEINIQEKFTENKVVMFIQVENFFWWNSIVLLEKEPGLKSYWVWWKEMIDSFPKVWRGCS